MKTAFILLAMLGITIQDGPTHVVPLSTTAPMQSVPPAKATVADELIETKALVITRDERITLPVSINGKGSYPFVVDTGSERTVIARELGEELKLVAGPQLKLATITGPYVTNSYLVARLSSGLIGVNDLEAPALDRGDLGASGLLGIDSLDNNKIHFDFRNRKLELFASKRQRGSKTGQIENGMIVVSARKIAGRLIISTAKINDMTVDIVIDTGAQSTMGNAALMQRLRRKDRSIDFIQTNLKSVTGQEVKAEFTMLKRVIIDKFEITDLPITFSENYAFEALDLNKRPAFLMGMDALQLFDRVVIDFGNRRVSFALPKNKARYRP